MVLGIVIDQERYPFLSEYATPVKKMERELVGREKEIQSILAGLARPEICNVLLLAPPGAGKTAAVQGTMAIDLNRVYLEVDLARMIANLKNENEMAAKLKILFGEAEMFQKTEGKELVLFIDEFHQIVELSKAAVEALKPLLADSGTRGIKVIAATTYTEFQDYIAPNQPLVERLNRINIPEPDLRTTVLILKGFAERYGVLSQFYGDHLFELIYEYTNRYVPANAQPRKSILILDAMVGWHKAYGKVLNRKLLADVIYKSEGVNVAFNVDGTQIKQRLSQRVLAQEAAVRAIENRLQVSVADLQDHTRPMGSLLFTGGTGTGKANTCSTIIPIYTADGSVTHKRAGDVVAGDFIFNREGKPVKVLGVFPQGKRQVYRVTLGDGRTLEVSDNHLWAVFPNRRSRTEGYTIYSTQTLLNKGLRTRHKGNREAMKYVIPMNGAMQWSARDFAVDPYVVGALIGYGCLKNPMLCISSDDEFVVSKIADLIGSAGYDRVGSDRYDWVFRTGDVLPSGRYRRIQQKDVLGDIPELFMTKSITRRIPYSYLTGSVEQRWRLVQGLFDTDGSIGACDGGCYTVTYSTHCEALAYDIQKLLYSLGVSSSVSCHVRKDKPKDSLPDYTVHVKSRNQDKWRFFTLPRKLNLAIKSKEFNKQREKTFDYVGIRSIEKLDYEEEMVCFYVDDEEHLYQAGDGCVSHNTEMSKALADLLFDNERALIRMDMSEFSQPTSVERFRDVLTTQIWEHPYSIVLLDEIEKACGDVTRILLQVLDDGRLINRHNREVSFVNCYIVMTTNLASEIYSTISQYAEDDTGNGKEMTRYMSLIRRAISEGSAGRFPPELLGRIDAIVPFQPLSINTRMQIVTSKLRKLAEDVKQKHGVELVFAKKVPNYLIYENLDTKSDSGGARQVIQRMNTEVVSAVARFINANPDVIKVGVSVDGTMAYENKNMLDSDAKISVQAVK